MLKDASVDWVESRSKEFRWTTAGTLLERLALRDAEAWAKLTTYFGPEVYRWCRKSGLQPSDAADVSQEVFRAVATNIAGFRVDRPGDSFRGWLWTIARNKIRDNWRRSVSERAVGGTSFQVKLGSLPSLHADLDESGHAEGGLGPEIVRHALERVREGFEGRTWEAFRGVVLDGQAPEDVSRALGMSVNAVYVAKSRVLGRLRAELGDLPL